MPARANPSLQNLKAQLWNVIEVMVRYTRNYLKWLITIQRT